MPELTFTNARLVLSDAVIDGGVSVEDGLIRSVDDAPSALAGALDLEGDYLLPGLVEIHTDNLEKHLQPRPGVMWPSSRAALFGQDAQVAAAGITTVLDSISMGEYAKNSNRRQMIATAFEAISDPAVRALTRAEHRLHLRCEITDPAVVELYEPLSADPLVALVSLMDHTPGQRQWADLDRFRTFHREKKWTDDEFAMNVVNRQAAQAENAEPNRQRILEIARANGTCSPAMTTPRSDMSTRRSPTGSPSQNSRRRWKRPRPRARTG